MTDNALSTTLAVFLISPVQLILIFLALIAVPATIIAIVFCVIWLVRRNRKPSPAPPPPPPPSATKRFCPQCGKEMSPDAPQGLCPSCLMQVALGTQSGELPKRDTPKPPPPAPSELAARFPQLEILELLGHGGMGAVYKARQKNLDRFVALKVLPAQAASDPGFSERFNREARALAKLSHPNIVGVYEYGQADGIPFFIMEFIDGVNLRQLQQAGKLEPREALKIIPQICEALQFAHDEGIVHRDIKPENVLLDKKGRAKIADFGLARILGREPSAFRLTGARDIMGTPHYMAPEQIEKPQTVDHRADIYSLGVVFYEMLTGELPLGRFAPPSEKVQLDVRLDEVVLKTLEKEPSRRYQHVGEVKTRLETISNQPGGGAAAAPVQPSWARGIDYKSKRTIFGMPFVHVATGNDPVTGRVRVARGFIAIGGVAQGVFAFGGVAMGIFAFGGLSLGLFAYGGLALGLLAIGGLAIALLGASGGLAIAPIALGGGAIGYFAKGGYAIATHRLDAVVRDPVAVDFFTPWATYWNSNFQTFNLVLFILTILIVTIVPPWLQRRSNHLDRQGAPRRGRGILFTTLAIVILILGLLGIGVWATWEAIKRPAQQRQQLARATLQTELRNQINTLLGDQRINYSTITLNFAPDAPEIRAAFVGLQNQRKVENGQPRPLSGELLLRFVSPEAFEVNGTGDLSFIKNFFLPAPAISKQVWPMSFNEGNPATPKIPYELGPIIERTVTLGEVNQDGLAFVNLEKPEITPSPFALQVNPSTAEILVHNSRIDEWIAASGMDLAIHLKESNWAWAPLGARTLFVEDETRFQLGNVTLEQAERVLIDTRSRKGTYVVHGAGMSAYPVTVSYIFKTREGTAGFLDLVGITNGVNGVKLRYRLAQPVAPPAQTSVAPPSSKPGELEFRLVAADGDTNTPADELADPNDRTGQTKLRVLKEVLLDSSAVTSANLETNVPPGAATTISVHMNDPQKLEQITTTNLGRRLAIVWRGRILSAPVIRTPITGHVISINGNLSDAETIVLLDLLNYQFDPDVIRKLKIAREELQKLRAKYTDAYPAVQDKQRAVEALEKAAIRR